MSNDPTCSGKKAKINPFGEEKKKKDIEKVRKIRLKYVNIGNQEG